MTFPKRFPDRDEIAAVRAEAERLDRREDAAHGRGLPEAGRQVDRDVDVEPVLAPAVGDCVGTFVELLVGELTALVDDRGAIPEANRAGGDRPSQHPVSFECTEDLSRLMGQREADHAAAKTERGEVGLVAESFGELHTCGNDVSGVEHSGVEIYDRNRLPTRATKLVAGVWRTLGGGGGFGAP